MRSTKTGLPSSTSCAFCVLLALFVYRSHPIVQIAAAEQNQSLSLGLTNTCVLQSNRVECFGFDEAGQTRVPELHRPTEVSVGILHACAITDSGIKCWG